MLSSSPQAILLSQCLFEDDQKKPCLAQAFPDLVLFQQMYVSFTPGFPLLSETWDSGRPVLCSAPQCFLLPFLSVIRFNSNWALAFLASFLHIQTLSPCFSQLTCPCFHLLKVSILFCGLFLPSAYFTFTQGF